MSLPARTDIDAQYRFDLTRIYETPAEWDEERETLSERLEALEARLDGPLDTTEDLAALLDTTEECYRRKQRLELYANLDQNIHTNDDAANDRLQRYRAIESEFEPVVAAVRRRLHAMDPDRFDALLDGLNGYRHYAENLRGQASHAGSADVEETIAAFESPRTAPGRIIRTITTEDFDPPTVERPDGQSVEIRYGNRRTELSSGNREYRRRVYEAYHGEMDRFEHTLARAYAEKLKAAATEAEVRGYDSIRDRDLGQRCYPESGTKSVLSEKVHDAMLDGVRENLEPYYRAYELREKRLGIETLRPWDLDVSIGGAEPPEWDYETAREHVLAALAPLGEDYVDRLDVFFDERRIDVFPTENKRTDIPAYCPSAAADGAYVLANFHNDVRTTFYLCHELGHAMCVGGERSGPVRYATCPRPVEEIPSILHELLLAEHLIAEGGALAAAATNQLLDTIGGNFYGAAMSSAFAHRLAGVVENGKDISVDRAREAWSDLQSEFRAPVEYDDRAGRNWLGRGTREPYSRYQYVLGATGALAVREKLRLNELTVAEYREFLRNTGRENSITLFDRIDCDVRSSDPYERAADAFDGYVATAEQSE